MRMRPWQILLAFTASYAVEIVPPSPYMSSPPPSQADTTVVDPNRKPRIFTTEPGTDELWFGGWNLATDQPDGSTPLDIKAPRSNGRTFRVAFNDHGWPTELTYFDVKGAQRWTKLFRYPAHVPAGGGDVPFTANWISSRGGAINLAKVSELFKSTPWRAKQRKYQVSDILGEPLVIESRTGGLAGAAETWVYLIDGKEVRFSFDKDNMLTAVPGEEAAAKPTPSAAAPSADSVKAKPAAPAPAAKPAKKK